MKANNTCKQRLNIFYTYNIIARIFYMPYTVGQKFSIHRIKMGFSDKIRLFFNSKHFNEHLIFSRRVKLFPEKVILFEWIEAFDRQCLYMYVCAMGQEQCIIFVREHHEHTFVPFLSDITIKTLSWRILEYNASFFEWRVAVDNVAMRKLLDLSAQAIDHR